MRLVTPTTPPERAAQIAARSTGFLYCVSVAGVTGARTELPPGLIERVQWLRTKTDVPIMVGFGISGPEQARQVAEVADGVIVGSALVRLLDAAAGRLVAEATAAIGGEPQVFLTGGSRGIVRDVVPGATEIPDLVLHGIALAVGRLQSPS